MRALRRCATAWSLFWRGPLDCDQIPVLSSESKFEVGIRASLARHDAWIDRRRRPSSLLCDIGCGSSV